MCHRFDHPESSVRQHAGIVVYERKSLAWIVEVDQPFLDSGKTLQNAVITINQR